MAKSIHACVFVGGQRSLHTCLAYHFGKVIEILVGSWHQVSHIPGSVTVEIAVIFGQERLNLGT